MKQDELNRCQIQEWYSKFKSVSLKTVIHELPEPFVEYLLDDSGPFLLPLSITGEDAFPNRICKPEDEEEYQVYEGSDDESEEAPSPPSFPELEQQIKASIEALEGTVFPKLNWSSPKDAAWISSTGSLKCVHSKRLVGVSQQEVTGFYPALVGSEEKLTKLIGDFFVDNVKGRFESENYTFDVYVTSKWKVKLMDFNPWGSFTLPLMFTWDELEEFALEEEDHGVDLRIVESRCGVRPGLKTAVPYDYLDTSAGSGWDEFLRKADEELKRETGSPECEA